MGCLEAGDVNFAHGEICGFFGFPVEPQAGAYLVRHDVLILLVCITKVGGVRTFEKKHDIAA